MVYISAIVFGSILTLAAEFVIAVIFVAWFVSKDKKGGESNAEESGAVPTSTYDRDGKENL